jgi:hypothetical protein
MAVEGITKARHHHHNVRSIILHVRSLLFKITKERTPALSLPIDGWERSAESSQT